MENEKSEIFQDIKRTVSTMAKDKNLVEKADELPGATVELSLSLLSLMGDLPAAESNRRERFKVLKTKLEENEWTDAQIDKELADKYKQDVSGKKSVFR